MRPHCGRFGMLPVTLDQVAPPSLVTCTTPSSVPTQMILGSSGEMVNERMQPNVSAPLMSYSMLPPLVSCLDLSLRVRSGLMGVQCAPPSVDLKRTFPPT